MKRNFSRLAAGALMALAALCVWALASPNQTAAAVVLSPEALGPSLGVVSLFPPLVTVVLAFLTKEVVTSLLAGSAVGLAILIRAEGGAGGLGQGALSVLRRLCATLLEVLTVPENCAILALCLIIGGLTALIRAAGGFEALAKRLSRHVKTPRQAQLLSELLGVAVFFDDYANSLIVGPVMRPITDRVGVSREKLAFLVDSTAAPVAGIALISSWIAAEVGAIDAGLAAAGVEASAYGVFLSSIPYCFYNLFCLVFIACSIALGRDYGPMYRAELRARGGRPVPEGSPEPEAAGEGKGSAGLFIAVGAVAFLCLYAVVGFYHSGYRAAVAAGLLAPGSRFSLSTLALAFSHADTVGVLVEAAVLTSLLALAVGVASGAFPFLEGVNAWLQGAGELLFTAVILGLAWTLSAIIGALGTAWFLSELIAVSLPFWLLPTLIFLACCIISFAAGSYGCMLMMMPMTVPVVIAVLSRAGEAVRDPAAFLACCVASVLAGSIFGDHCSPVTDTTILSAQGAGCALLAHVRTQLPYALTVAAVSALCGTLLTGLGASPLLTLPLGAALLWLILRFSGKKIERPH